MKFLTFLLPSPWPRSAALDPITGWYSRRAREAAGKPRCGADTLFKRPEGVVNATAGVYGDAGRAAEGNQGVWAGCERKGVKGLMQWNWAGLGERV